MASFYLDNDVSIRLARLLLKSGHLAFAAKDLGFSAATDNEHLLVAVRNDWILVTHNRTDFTLLHDAWGSWPLALGLELPLHPGILALGQGPPELL